MTTGTGKMNKREMREDKGTPKQEIKAARAKSSEKPMKSHMGHVEKAKEHMEAAAHHHKEAKKYMAKCKK